MYSLPKGVMTPVEFSRAVHHAIGLELATIPCYLSTYYSIHRTPSQDDLFQQIRPKVKDDATAKELALDIVVYANMAGGVIMSVVIEEMLHLALSSNIHQSLIGPPDLLGLGKSLTYPAKLFKEKKREKGEEPEFDINRAPLSIEQLVVLLKIESPNSFEPEPTIGEFYDTIEKYIKNKVRVKDFAIRKEQPQLVPSQPYYSQNSINTVYYDRKHNPKFPSDESSGGIIEVVSKKTAIAAIEEIIHQGEGYTGGDTLKFDDKTGLPVGLPVDKKGKVIFVPEDYDPKNPKDVGIVEKELAHFDKFMELYSLALYYQDKFDKHGLTDFFSYFVYQQDTNPVTTDYYPDTTSIYCQSQLANAIYTYILLMIETCYYQKLPTQYEVFMMGIHKSMIWLLSEFGNGMRSSSYMKDGKELAASVTFEYYPFENKKGIRPKDQIVQLSQKLIDVTTSSGSSPFDWLLSNPQYVPSLPDVGLDHKVLNPNGKKV